MTRTLSSRTPAEHFVERMLRILALITTRDLPMPKPTRPPSLDFDLADDVSAVYAAAVTLGVEVQRYGPRVQTSWPPIEDRSEGTPFVTWHAHRDADPTGLAYTRADDDPDDPTPVSPARVPMHTGAVTDGGLVDETERVHMVYADGGRLCGKPGPGSLVWAEVTCPDCIGTCSDPGDQEHDHEMCRDANAEARSAESPDERAQRYAAEQAQARREADEAEREADKKAVVHVAFGERTACGRPVSELPPLHSTVSSWSEPSDCGACGFEEPF